MVSFVDFWSRYPKRVARKDAEKAWRQVNADDHLIEIFTALEWQVTQPSWTKDDGAYVPYPATWLRGERWTDERPMSADEKKLRADFALWQQMHAHDPQVKHVTFQQFQAFRLARRQGVA